MIKELISRVRDILIGEDGAPPLPPAGANSDGNPDAICYRLERESADDRQPEIRGLFQEAFDDNCRKLNDALVCLMFNLTPPAGGFLDQWLVQALARQTSLKVHRSVFYLYVDMGFRAPSARELSQFFAERVVELAREAEPLENLLEARFRGLGAGVPFDLEDPRHRHRDRIRNLLGYNFKLCRKHFPDRLRGRVYVVGKLPLHDIRAIGQYQQEQAAEAAATKTDLPLATVSERTTVYVAARILAEGSYKESRARLNAHRFDDYHGPLYESELCVGSWLSDWEFSIGSADHDEISCAAFGETSCRLLLDNLHLQATSWNYSARYDPEELIPGLKCYKTRKTETPRDNIHLKVFPHSSTNSPLVERISRQTFRQEVKLMARLLPLTGGLDEFADANEGLRRSAGRALSPLAAIQLRQDVWLARNDDDTVRCVYRRRTGQWEEKTMADGEQFPLEGFVYTWSLADEETYPSKFFGKLSIKPPDDQVGEFNRQLAVDEDADSLPIAYKETFPNTINPDPMLGTGEGVVSIKCHRVREDGRGQYIFLPADKPGNPFFAVRPSGLSKTWPVSDNKWLAYEGISGQGELTKNNKGRAVYNDRHLIVADEYSFDLICGTSVFQIKVSGTPQINVVRAGAQAGRATSPAAVVSEPGAPLPPPAAAEPAPATPLTLDDVRMKLLDTRWADYEINRLDQSNFAIHCSLVKGDESYFLKAYFPESAESAKREAAFYDAFGARASELFIEPPDILHEGLGGPPWGLVFPRLVPLHEWPPASKRLHLAQAAAIGYGFSKMLRALAADNRINFDVDQTMLCFRESGRMAIVDFDNVYPLLTDPNDPKLLAPSRGIWEGGVLPAKNPCLPPEAAGFDRLGGSYDRQQALTRIGAPFGTYMLAVMLLQLLKADRLDERRLVTVAEGGLAAHAGAEDAGADAAAGLEKLLREMLNPEPDRRPEPDALVVRFAALARAFAGAGEASRREVTRLLDTVP